MWLAVILVMGMIFRFSAQDAEESTQVSTLVGRAIGRIVHPGFGDLTARQQEAFAINIDFYVRKGAHASVYAALGFLFSGAFAWTNRFKNRSGRWVMLISWLCGTLYAMTDEFHQLFVPGRSGEIRDVCLDSAGVLVGVFIGRLLWTALRRRHWIGVEKQ